MTDKRDAVVEAARRVDHLETAARTAGNVTLMHVAKAALRASLALLDSPLPSDEELRDIANRREVGMVTELSLDRRLWRVYADALRLAADQLHADGYHETTSDLIDDIRDKFLVLADEMENRG